MKLFTSIIELLMNPYADLIGDVVFWLFLAFMGLLMLAGKIEEVIRGKKKTH